MGVGVMGVGVILTCPRSIPTPPLLCVPRTLLYLCCNTISFSGFGLLGIFIPRAGVGRSGPPARQLFCKKTILLCSVRSRGSGRMARRVAGSARLALQKCRYLSKSNSKQLCAGLLLCMLRKVRVERCSSPLLRLYSSLTTIYMTPDSDRTPHWQPHCAARPGGVLPCAPPRFAAAQGGAHAQLRWG